MRVAGPLLSLALALVGCGGGTPAPDYLDWFTTEADPQHEAEATERALARSGYVLTQRLEGPGWIALDARRGEYRRIRVITTRGVALALDSHEADGVVPRHGAIELVPAPEAGAHDLDGDGRDELVVAGRHGTQRCLLPFRAFEDGHVVALVPDTAELGPDVCVESLGDVDRNGRVEGIAVLRLHALARTELPTVEVALELDLRGRFRAGPPPVGFMIAQRTAREDALREAVAAADAERVYRLALELAALSRIAGHPRDQQLRTFDDAIRRVVLSAELVAAVLSARSWIASGWGVTAEPSP